MYIRYFIVLIGFVSLWSSCLFANPSLDGTEWWLVEYRSGVNAKTWQPKNAAGFSLRLQEDGKAFIRLDCNQGVGAWKAGQDQAESGRFNFIGLAVTEALCSSDDGYGHKLTKVLASVRAYRLQSGYLYLEAAAGLLVWGPEGQGANELTSHSYGFSNSEPQYWQVADTVNAVKLREKPSVMAAILERYPATTVFDNLGCEEIEKRLWCHVQVHGQETQGFISADYLEPIALSEDKKVSR